MTLEAVDSSLKFQEICWLAFKGYFKKGQQNKNDTKKMQIRQLENEKSWQVSNDVDGFQKIGFFWIANGFFESGTALVKMLFTSSL